MGEWTGTRNDNFMRRRYRTNVLLVDDSATMRKIVARALKEAGLTVGEIYEAGNGIEGLAVLASPDKEVHLILSDVNMPGMDGVEFVAAVRKSGCSLPIVMVTTETTDVLERAFENGALSNIKKPFTAEQLREKLGNFF